MTSFTGDLRFLSNFDTTPFHVGTIVGTHIGRPVKSGEHIFNALKSTSHTEQELVLGASTPAEAKRLGRRVQLRSDWDTGVRVYVMQQIQYWKFKEGSKLSERLLATGDDLLVETNTWHDQFWGDCTCEGHSWAPGTNMLGQILMSRRFALKLLKEKNERALVS